MDALYTDHAHHRADPETEREYDHGLGIVYSAGNTVSDSVPGTDTVHVSENSDRQLGVSDRNERIVHLPFLADGLNYSGENENSLSLTRMAMHAGDGLFYDV